MLIILSSLLAACGDSQESPPTACTQENCESDSTPQPAGGHLSNPRYRWQSIEGAYHYRLRVEDHRGNTFSQRVTAVDAACQDSASYCEFTPDIEMHDSILSWRTEAYDVAGLWLTSSVDTRFNTRRSLSAQPYTDLDSIGAPPNPGNGWPTIDFDNYLLLNNDWNAAAVNSDQWQQTVAADKALDGSITITLKYDWLNQDSGDEYAVKSYPQVVYGSKLGAHVSGSTEETGLPKTISELEEFQIDYRYSESGNAERNLAFESFFHTSCNIGGPNFDDDNRAYEMMVWIANPAIRTPGSLQVETGVMIDNQLWDVWIKPLQDKEYIAFTAQTELTEATLHWNRFVDWTLQWSATNATTHSIVPLNRNWCMSAIEFGVETWWGASTLTLENFQITRN